MPFLTVGRVSALLALLLAALGMTLLAANSPRFLAFAINADTLYPALLAEELRADLATLERFRPSRIPSYLPDLAIFVSLDLVSGSWRFAWWGYGFVAFILLCTVGGHLASLALGRPFHACTAAMALLTALLVLAGLAHYSMVAGQRPASIVEADLPVNLHLMLLMPVFQSGAFIAGLGIIALVWRCITHPSLATAISLAALTTAATASNSIVVAHAVLPCMIALSAGVLRRDINSRQSLWAAVTLVFGSIIGTAAGNAAGREDLPLISPVDFVANTLAALGALPGQPMIAVALLASLPIALAYFYPTAAARRLGAQNLAAFRFVLTVACAAIAAGLTITLPLYYIPLSWRYANPIAWWPAILLAGMLATPLASATRRPGILPLVTAILLTTGAATSSRLRQPALFNWQPDVATCLDRLDPSGQFGAGLADYWNARLLAAGGNWRRQIDQIHGNGSAALYINDPNSFLRQRHDSSGTPPNYEFVVMLRLDPARIQSIYGMPTNVLRCGDGDIWIYPQGVLAEALRDASPDLEAWRRRN
jgi:hypothetical protein